MANEVTVYPTSGNAILLHKETFEQAYRVARLFSASKLVPTHFQGKEADCFIALMVATRMGEDPLTVMQNMYVVNGTPGWKTQYMISRTNRAGVFSSPIIWDTQGEGEAMKVTARAVLAATADKISVTVSMAMAKAEGWTRNTKYQTMPEHMLCWRSATMLIRLYAPEVMLGYQTAEELETTPALRDITPPSNVLTNIENGIKAEKAAAIPHDPTTGEIQQEVAAQNAEAANADFYAQPAKIPAKAMPGDATKTDWDAWAAAWGEMVAEMADAQSLNKMRKLNESILANMEKINPPKHNWCLEQFTARMVDVGGVEVAA